MITVIATGFDASRRRERRPRRAPRQHPFEVARRGPRPERDFLEELERQRHADAAEPEPARPRRSAPSRPSARVERTRRGAGPGRAVASYDADDLEIPSFLRREVARRR